MIFADHPVLIRGGGDLATGVAYRLHKAGFPIIVLELSRPLVVRRRVALATAVLEGEIEVDGLRGKVVATYSEALHLSQSGIVPVLVSPDLPPSLGDTTNNRPGEIERTPPAVGILIDGRMAKRNIDTSLDQASLVITLGPGFTAGIDCHAIIETKRGHSLGRVIWSGRAIPNSGRPGIVDGRGQERVLRAPVAGTILWQRAIGDLVSSGERIGAVTGQPVLAPFDGVIRGQIAPDFTVAAGDKIGDLDPRADIAACFTISDKALSIGGGVLEAILTWMNLNQQPGIRANGE